MVSKSRQALTGLSDWGRVLAYHDSVPQTAEEMWKQERATEATEDEAKEIRQKLIEWYAKRNRERRLPHGAVGSSEQG